MDKRKKLLLISLIFLASAGAIIVTRLAYKSRFHHLAQESSKNFPWGGLESSGPKEIQTLEPPCIIGQEFTAQILRLSNGRIVLFESQFASPCRVFQLNEDTGELTLLGSTKLSHDNAQILLSTDGTILLWGGIEYFCTGSYDAYRDAQNFESYDLTRGMGTPLPVPHGYHTDGTAVLLNGRMSILIGGRQNLGPVWDQEERWTGDKRVQDGLEVFDGDKWIFSSLKSDLSWCVLGGTRGESILLWGGSLTQGDGYRPEPSLGPPLGLDLKSGEIQTLGEVSWNGRAGRFYSVPGLGGIRWDQATGQCFFHADPADLEGRKIPGLIETDWEPRVGGFDQNPLLHAPTMGAFWRYDASHSTWEPLKDLPRFSQDQAAAFWIGQDGRFRVITSGNKAEPILKVFGQNVQDSLPLKIAPIR